jgi:hypothetical protein
MYSWIITDEFPAVVIFTVGDCSFGRSFTAEITSVVLCKPAIAHASAATGHLAIVLQSEIMVPSGEGQFFTSRSSIAASPG